MQTLTKDDFQDSIAKGISIVKFGASWCGPCRAMKPIFEKLSEELPEECLVAEVDVEEVIEETLALDIQTVPVVIVFKDGKERRRFHGAVNTVKDYVDAVKEVQE